MSGDKKSGSHPEVARFRDVWDDELEVGAFESCEGNRFVVVDLREGGWVQFDLATALRVAQAIERTAKGLS